MSFESEVAMALRRLMALFLGLLLTAAPARLLAAAAAPSKDPDITRGLKLVDEGDYDDAIVALDSAVRRLAADASRKAELAEAYLYLGIAYLAKGQETAAKAKFREALTRAGDLSLSADRFPPKVVDIFEAARDEVRRSAPASSAPAAAAPAASAPPAEKKGGSKTGLILLGVGGAAAVGAAVALAGGGGDSAGGEETSTFPNETVVFGGGRDFVVDVKGSGTLTATVDWQQDGVVLGMYIVNLATPQTVLMDAGQTASKQARLSLGVTAGSYRISVNNSTGHGPVVTTTFTLTVKHP
jgi:hypothetical protein